MSARVVPQLFYKCKFKCNISTLSRVSVGVVNKIALQKKFKTNNRVLG